MAAPALMPHKRRLYLYPQTPFGQAEGDNDYMRHLRAALDGPFEIVNRPTRSGLLNLLRHLPHTDIVYFNWIEDLVEKRFGYAQLCLLPLLLLWCRLGGKQVVWFVHNVVSHRPRHWRAKRFTAALMAQFADTVLAHADEAAAHADGHDVAVFDHPLPPFTPLPEAPPRWDLLLWGSVQPYKGVLEFIRLHAARPGLHNLKVLVAGRFDSPALLADVQAAAHPNVTLRNEVVPEAELSLLLRNSRYVLFAYRPGSVLASGAVSRTLAFGKTVIAPRCGAFRSLDASGLLYNYGSDDELVQLLERLQAESRRIDPERLRRYAEETGWDRFGVFLQEQLAQPAAREGWGFVLR